MKKTLRTWAKKIIFGRLPGLAGKFRYYGTVVHFPPGAFVFDILAEEGIYEADLLRQIQIFLRPNSCYFDVGANIGCMSVPILKSHPDVKVISIEPSPNSLPFLERTHAGSKHQDRWTLIGKAMGNSVGTVKFSIGDSKFAGYDGLKFTQRRDQLGSVDVPMTTLDIEWEAQGCPDVSCIKLDIEGAEMAALAGGERMLQACRPAIFMEWYEPNFKWFDVQIADLLEFAERHRYQIVATPTLYEIRTLGHLRMAMGTTGNVALIPL